MAKALRARVVMQHGHDGWRVDQEIIYRLILESNIAPLVASSAVRIKGEGLLLRNFWHPSKDLTHE